jgi:hypothetical protein
MFFYIFHQINHAIRKDDDTGGSVNTRTLIFGGLFYILTHAYISTPGNFFNFYRDYLWYIFILDCSVMGYTYKSYFGRSIFKEITIDDDDEYDEKNHKYIKTKLIDKKNDKIVDSFETNNNNEKNEVLIEEENKKDEINLVKGEEIINNNINE